MSLIGDAQEAKIRFETEHHRHPTGIRMHDETARSVGRQMGMPLDGLVSLVGLPVTIDDTVVVGDFVLEGHDLPPMRDPLEFP